MKMGDSNAGLKMHWNALFGGVFQFVQYLISRKEKYILKALHNPLPTTHRYYFTLLPQLQMSEIQKRRIDFQFIHSLSADIAYRQTFYASRQMSSS